MERDRLVSIVITTYNRADALLPTLEAFGKQTLAPVLYEVVVVNNGSADHTTKVLDTTKLPCRFRHLSLAENRGYCGGMNTAIKEARGRYLVLVSDDLIVPPEFLATHVQTLEQFPGWWVVGGIEQLEAVTQTPFGAYLEYLEKTFEEARKLCPLGPNLWELGCPTARNLSLPADHLDQIGLFDERFPFGCEDQDLAHRAQAIGVRFLYNATITCLHNDGNATLRRCGRSQQIGAYSTVFFCAKYPALHGNAAITKVNGYPRCGDGVRLACKKMVKSILARERVLDLLEKGVSLAERLSLPESILYRMYRAVIGLYLFRGWRLGLEALERKKDGAELHEGHS